MDCSHSLSKTVTPLSILFFSLLYIANFASAFNLSTITFNQGYTPLFSDFNILRSSDDRSVSLILNRFSGSGFISSDYYNYGLFSANIKLPANYSAGIVVAFYTSNGDVFEKTHDELDFEFLGSPRGKSWRFQTNLYGNGSTNRGREERYTLWFDPTKEFHRYVILWTSKSIIFYVDEVPIREIVRSDAMGADYPSKPMSLYATIWDGSSWATSGGKYKVNYRFQPFVSEFKDLVLEGCAVDPIQQFPAAARCDDKTAMLEAADYAAITPDGRKAMSRFRERYMYYSYCYDFVRYPVPPPECVIVPSEQHLFKDTGRLKEALKMKFGRHQKHRRRSSRRRSQEPLRGRATLSPPPQNKLPIPAITHSSQESVKLEERQSQDSVKPEEDQPQESIKLEESQQQESIKPEARQPQVSIKPGARQVRLESKISEFMVHLTDYSHSTGLPREGSDYTMMVLVYMYLFLFIVIYKVAPWRFGRNWFETRKQAFHTRGKTTHI